MVRNMVPWRPDPLAVLTLSIFAASIFWPVVFVCHGLSLKDAKELSLIVVPPAGVLAAFAVIVSLKR